jgi:hypothetical protein
MVDDELLKALKNINLKDICLIKHACKHGHLNKMEPMIVHHKDENIRKTPVRKQKNKKTNGKIRIDLAFMIFIIERFLT